jgi:L-malate glycosyltransferase
VPARVEGWLIRNIENRFRRMRHLLGVRLSALSYNATICVSEAIRGSLVGDYRFPAGKTVTIHNGVSLSRFGRSENGRRTVRTRAGIASEEFLFVCVARLSEQKAIDILLLAIARVLERGVRCKCVIVGDGPLRKQLSEQSVALGLSGYVFFEGFQEDVRPYLHAADGFVLTSHKEGLPLALLEAMACGLPCVVTGVGGNIEALTHGLHGLIVPPGSVDAIADAMSYLITHPRACAEMSKAAQARVRQQFDIEECMAQIKGMMLKEFSDGAPRSSRDDEHHRHFMHV